MSLLPVLALFFLCGACASFSPERAKSSVAGGERPLAGGITEDASGTLRLGDDILTKELFLKEARAQGFEDAEQFGRNRLLYLAGLYSICILAPFVPSAVATGSPNTSASEQKNLLGLGAAFVTLGGLEIWRSMHFDLRRAAYRYDEVLGLPTAGSYQTGPDWVVGGPVYITCTPFWLGLYIHY